MEVNPQKLVFDAPFEEQTDQPLEMASGRCPARDGGRGRGDRGGRWASVIAEIENLTNGMFLSLKEVTR
jgi:hypothetical protein